ncbi:MAG: hypothetical protein JKP98_08110 [Rhodobacteraceae bacterium]|nr:hypothetical protein [Paracoccaceae bacterium]
MPVPITSLKCVTVKSSISAPVCASKIASVCAARLISNRELVLFSPSIVLIRLALPTIFSISSI